MCKYCNDIFTDYEAFTKLKQKKIRFGKNCYYTLNVDLWTPYPDRNGNIKTVLEVNMNNYDYEDDGLIFDEKIKIKYCPFCGKKLPTHIDELE